MKKKETKTAEEKIMKYLQSRKKQIIRAKQINVAMRKTGSVAYKTGATALARLCREGKLERVRIGVYTLPKIETRKKKSLEVKSQIRSEKTKGVTALGLNKHFSDLEKELNWDKTPEAVRFFELNPLTKRYYFELMNKVKSKYRIYLPNLQDNWNFVADCFNSHTLLDDACEMVGHQNSTKPLKFNMALLTKYPSLSPSQIPLPDAVNHPTHYTDGKIEVIDYIEDKAFGFHLGNVVKYVSRAGKKNASTKVQDLEKARWYLDRIIANLKKQK